MSLTCHNHHISSSASLHSTHCTVFPSFPSLCHMFILCSVPTLAWLPIFHSRHSTHNPQPVRLRAMLACPAHEDVCCNHKHVEVSHSWCTWWNWLLCYTETSAQSLFFIASIISWCTPSQKQWYQDIAGSGPFHPSTNGNFFVYVLYGDCNGTFCISRTYSW